MAEGICWPGGDGKPSGNDRVSEETVPALPRAVDRLLAFFESKLDAIA